MEQGSVLRFKIAKGGNKTKQFLKHFFLNEKYLYVHAKTDKSRTVYHTRDGFQLGNV